MRYDLPSDTDQNARYWPPLTIIGMPIAIEWGDKHATVHVAASPYAIVAIHLSTEQANQLLATIDG